MRRITIREVAFGSFLKLTTVVGAAIGVGIGLWGLLGSLFGAPVTITVNGTEVVTGPGAGLFSVPILGVLLAVAGFFSGIVAHLPFRWFLRMTGGMTLWTRRGSTSEPPRWFGREALP